MRPSSLYTFISVTVTSLSEALTRKYYQSTSNTSVTSKENISLFKESRLTIIRKSFYHLFRTACKNAHSGLENSIAQIAVPHKSALDPNIA